MKKENIKKFKGVQLLVASSSFTILLGLGGLGYHISREIKDFNAFLDDTIHIPRGINIDVYDYAYQNNIRVVKINDKYYEWAPRRDHEISFNHDRLGNFEMDLNGDILATDIQSGLFEAVYLDELTLLDMPKNHFAIPSFLPKEGEFIYIPSEEGAKIYYNYYDSEHNEYLIYELEDSLRKTK